MTKDKLIDQLGASDQAYLLENTPELALHRGQLRLALAALSVQKGETLYLLNEALVILENARLNFSEMPMPLYLALSVTLAEAYIACHKTSGQHHYAVIAEQILRPLAHHNDAKIYAMLATASQLQGKQALARHWHNKALMADTQNISTHIH